MKKITNYELRNIFLRSYGLMVLRSYGLMVLRSYGLMVLRSYGLMVFLLSIFAITNAQVDENIILNPDSLQKNELKITQEIEKMMVNHFYSIFIDAQEKELSDHGIKNRSQLENLNPENPIPLYEIVNKDLEGVYTYNVSRMSDKEPLSLKFTNTWSVPVLSAGEPLLFGLIQFSDFEGYDPFIWVGNYNSIEHYYKYEYKDSIIGSVGVNPSSRGMDYLIIRKENKVLFVQVYDEATGEYFKNEYSFSEVINQMKESAAKVKEAQRRFFNKIANKSELEMTPEITEMVVNSVKNSSDQVLSNFRIQNRSQLENLQLGKPIPEYWIDYDNEKPIFAGNWNVLVMSSNGEPLVLVMVRLAEDEQYKLGRIGAAEIAYRLHNFKDKNLVIGSLGTIRSSLNYLIIRKEQKDIFVEMYDYATRKYFVNEYSLSEIMNLLKR